MHNSPHHAIVRFYTHTHTHTRHGRRKFIDEENIQFNYALTALLMQPITIPHHKQHWQQLT